MFEASVCQIVFILRNNFNQQHCIIIKRMKLNQELRSSYRSTKNLHCSPNNKKVLQKLVSSSTQKPVLLPPPLLCQQEKTQRKRTCLSPPPSFLFQSNPESSANNKLTSRKNPEFLQTLQLKKKTSDGKYDLNKSFDHRPPPSFLLKGSKKNQLTNTLKKISKEKRIDNVSPNKKEVWSRLSANPAFFTKMIDHCKSEFSSKQKQIGESPRKPSVNSAVSINGHSEKAKNNNKMVIPPKVWHKTKSEINFNPNPQSSKVPAFIRKKEYAKSQNPSSNNSEKGVSLFQMMKADEVSSQEGQQIFQDLGITINIKPAQKKKTIHDFQILKELGEGSYGKACMALEKQIGFICVLKILDKEKLTEFQINNLLREVKIQLYLNHDHLTSLYGLFDDDENIYLVMELLPSGNLKDLKGKQALPEEVVSHIVSQVCSGIMYMHKNHVLHRDLKPENIFAFDNYMKLGDFGCAVYSDITRNSFVGSPCYLSPEQLKNEFYDEKVDMWEIGTLTYELLFKKCPFQKDILEMMQGQRKCQNLSELRFPAMTPISQGAKDFLKRSLEKDPSRRMSLQEAVGHSFLKQKKPQIPKFD